MLLSINFDSQFSVVFNLSGIHDHTDNSEESVSEEVLKKATECTEEETMFYLSDDEFSQVWGTYGRGNYTIRDIHSLRIYRQFSRRMLLRCGTRSGERARGRNRKLKNREQSRELVIINEVIDMASIQVRFFFLFFIFQFSCSFPAPHSPFPVPHFSNIRFLDFANSTTALRNLNLNQHR